MIDTNASGRDAGAHARETGKGRWWVGLDFENIDTKRKLGSAVPHYNATIVQHC